MSYEPTVIPPFLKKSHHTFINPSPCYDINHRNLKPYYGYYSIVMKDGKCYSVMVQFEVGVSAFVSKIKLVEGLKKTLLRDGYTLHDIVHFKCKYCREFGFR